MQGKHRWERVWTAALFFLLCLLVASRWLIENGIPATASTFRSQAMGDSLAAGAFGVLIFARRPSNNMLPVDRRHEWMRALAGALLLCGPAIGELAAGGNLGAGNVTLALSLVPVVVAVASASQHGSEGDMIGHLWPGLAGLTGLLLLLPKPSFSSTRAWVGLALIPLLTGLGVAFVPSGGHDHVSDGRANRSRGYALICCAAAVVMVLSDFVNHDSHIALSMPLQAAGLDAATTSATLLVLGRVGAQRFSAVYLLVPLLTVLEGVLFLHPGLDLRSCIGLALMTTGAARLLFSATKQPAQGLTLELPERVPPA